MRNRLRRIVPWIVAAGVLAYLFWRVPPSEVLEGLRTAAPWAVPVIAALTFVVYLADSLAIQRTFAWFVARLSFREVLVVRGATYLLAILNYSIGQGAIIYFVHRSRGVPVMRGAGAVLLVMGINVLLLLVVGSIGVLVNPDVPTVVGTLVTAGYAGLALYLVLLAWKPRWLASRPLFDVLLGAGVRGHLKALVVRLPHLASLITLSYVSLRAFHVAVPLGYALLCLPVVYLIAVLPISPMGLGTTQGMMIYFFARFAPGDAAFGKAIVLACSLSTQAVAFAVQAAIGLVCLRNQMARNLPASTP